MTHWNHPDGPADYAEVGRGAPEPYTGEPTWLPGQTDALDELARLDLADRTRAYYDGPDDDGAPCPICDLPKPFHVHGCSEAAEGEPSYRYYPEEHDPWRS